MEIDREIMGVIVTSTEMRLQLLNERELILRFGLLLVLDTFNNFIDGFCQLIDFHWSAFALS